MLDIIEQVSSYYREVLFYSTVYEMNSTKIGELLGRPAAKIQKQLTRARAMLANLCEQEGA